MIYQWNDDLNIVTQQTEESKRAGEVLENLKLGCVSSKDSSDTDTDNSLTIVHLLALSRHHDRQN
jgi:hypothetical protein